MTTLNVALENITRLGFDTSPIIYFVEAHPTYDTLVTSIFQRVANRTLMGYTSAVSLTEVLVHPLQQNKLDLQKQYHQLLLASANFKLISIDHVIAEQAAELRARYNLRTPDALQIAAALAVHCQAFLTNDKRLKNVTELQILVLDELEL